MVDNRADLFGDYAPAADPKFVTTPYESLKSLAQTSSNETGCSDGNKCDHYDSSKIQTAVKDASVIIVCLGTGMVKYHLVVYDISPLCMLSILIKI